MEGRRVEVRGTEDLRAWLALSKIPPMTSVYPSGQTQPLRKVLLIEDERGQARIVEASFAKFEKERFEFHWASSYEAGLAALLQNQFDACLLDYQLGPRSGLDLLREVVSIGIDTPVIFVTSESSTEVDEQALELGALDYLVKRELSPRGLERSLRYTIKQHATLRELRRLSTRDQLTGLYNREEGLNLLTQGVDRARKFSRSFAVMFIDIDHFEAVTAIHGHAAGDERLVALARIVQDSAGESGVGVRWGTDAFGLWLPDMDAVSASRLGESILGAARQLELTLSIGVAEWNGARAEVTDLLAAATRALGEAQAAGGDRVA